MSNGYRFNSWLAQECNSEWEAIGDPFHVKFPAPVNAHDAAEAAAMKLVEQEIHEYDLETLGQNRYLVMVGSEGKAKRLRVRITYQIVCEAEDQ